MAYEVVLYEKRGHIATLTLNRPERMNAFNQALQSELHAALEEAKADDEVRALIVTGAGRGFSSGADLRGGMRPRDRDAQSQNERLDAYGWTGRLGQWFGDIDKPVIGAINGAAVGAGMGLALACDMRIGSENTRFKTTFIERGLSPEAGISYHLPRIIGYARAADLLFTSRMVEAEEAYRLGLLDRLVDHSKLAEESQKLAEQMTCWPPLALRMTKRVLRHNLDATWDDALQYEVVGVGLARRAKNDSSEAMKAFTEKRMPTYTGT